MSVLVGLVAAVLMIIGVAGLTGKLPYNLLIGIRIAPVMKSDETWEAGHRAAAPLFIGVGLCGLTLLLLEEIEVVGGERARSIQVWYMWAVLAALLIGTMLAIRAVRALG